MTDGRDVDGLQVRVVNGVRIVHPYRADDHELVTDGGREGGSSDRSGLYGKYKVRKDGEPVEDCFVLRPESDPAALQALGAYVYHSDDEELNRDLMDWVAEIGGSGGSGRD